MSRVLCLGGLVWLAGCICLVVDFGREEAFEVEIQMNNRKLGKLLERHIRNGSIEGQPGYWIIRPQQDEQESAKAPDVSEPNRQSEEHFTEQDDAEVMLVITDENADRMRIMMPITRIDIEQAESVQLSLIALSANYDRALDARYALQDEILWSVFLHPLGSLTEQDLVNALKQVQTFRNNTGTTFSNSELVFAPANQGDDSEDEQREEPPGSDFF